MAQAGRIERGSAGTGAAVDGGRARDALPEAANVAILRALPGLGDTLCAIPAVRALRRARPDVSISVITHERAIPVWERYPGYADRLIPFPGWPGLPDRRPDIGQIPGFLALMQQERFDLAIQLQGDGRVVNSIIALLGARRTAGFYPLSEPTAPRGAWLPWRDGISEVRRGLRLMGALGLPARDDALEFTIAGGVLADDGVVRTVFPRERDAEHRAPVAVIHPGASVPSRRWPIDRFARVADGLAAQGMRIVITGSVEERPLGQRLQAAMRCAATDVTGRTSLDEVAEILRRSAVLVCNDTGVSHLAAALRVPSVVVFTDSEVARWAPLDTTLHRPAQGSPEQVLYQARRVARRPDRHAA